ncbi:hypothetical protein PY650_05940 [Rhizobium calliandrae]|uniref:ATP-binding protein n=1 Tax=Rhizobium calliandrae TaxID=1312182 RepID=A0ABT7KB08_9HYPH|nr:hypothetical protein [Rhizobium calliandrae]MDL2405200.1 hypothetical protein [Rhizobium calliandrae]
MPNPDINFRNIRNHRNSQNDGFEELTRQLVLAEPPEGASEIEHRGPGADGGVELLARFPDARVWGWQSKYFPDGFGSSEVGQLKKSFKSALSNYPKLEKYYVAIPRNLSGHAEGENETQTKNWQGFKTWCKDLAAAENRTVEIVLWDDTYFVSRLQRGDPAHAGMRLYWFDQAVLDQKWFERQLEKSLGYIGKRYREVDHVDVKIGNSLKILERHPEVSERLKSVSTGLRSSIEMLMKSIRLLPADDGHIGDFNATSAALSEISQSLEQADLSALRQGQVTDLLKRLRSLDRDPSVDFVLNHARFMTREDPTKPEGEREVYVYGGDVRKLLGDLRGRINGCASVFSVSEVELFHTPFLLVGGEAGIGKSHLIAREVQRHVQGGFPAIFVPGRTLDNGDKPESEILEYLDLKDLRFDVFLGAVNAAAKASGCPALLALDGINESFNAAGWNAGLAALLPQLKAFDCIGFCVTVRSAYKDLCVRSDLELVQISHTGFAGNLGEAAREYLDRHKIERPSAPIFELRDILYNPLFLTTAVDFLQSTNKTAFPRGLDSIGELIVFWLDAIEINLTTKGYQRIERGDGKLIEVAWRLAAVMAEQESEYVEFNVANKICEEVTDLAPPAKSADRLLTRLIDEGMLLDAPYFTRGAGEKRVSFAFQKFSDYFVADAITRATGSPQKLAAAIKSGGKYHYLFDEGRQWQFTGPRVALFALTPLRFGKELPNLEPDLDEFLFMGIDDLVSSLRWRQGNEITSETQALIEALRNDLEDGTSSLADDVWFDLLLRLATDPYCRLNARYLKRTLATMKLGERDATWSVYLVNKTETYDDDWSIVQDLINWAWIAPAANLSPEKIHLVATTLGLMTSTMDREVRDSATKALSSLLIHYPAEIPTVIEEFRDWDDPYVRERVLAAAMAGVLNCVDPSIVRSAAVAADRMVFAKVPVERHAWVRRYASLIVGHALNRGISLEDGAVERSKPPYASDPISKWPSLEDLVSIHDQAREIFGSVAGYLSEPRGSEPPTMVGDFGRYTMSGIDSSFSAEPRGTVPPLSREAEIELFWRDAEEFTARAGTLRNKLESVLALQAETSMSKLIAGLSDAEDAVGSLIESVAAEKVDQVESEEEERRLQDTYDGLVATLVSILSPELRERFSELDPLVSRRDSQIEKFSILKARYWVVQRTVDLGWNSNIHGDIERNALRASYGRGSHQVERIGKKYQHIAHQELIGYLADYHWYVDWYEPPTVLEHMEDFEKPDIDPTFLAGDFSRLATSFFPDGITFPVLNFTPSSPRENVDWTKSLIDIPDVVPFLVQTDASGQEWYLQRSFVRNAKYMDNLHSTAPFRNAQYGVELVLFRQEDLAKLIQLNTKVLGGDDGDVFESGRDNKSFFGQRSYEHATEAHEFPLHSRIGGLKFARFAESYTPKFGEYDFSGTSSETDFAVPSIALVASGELKPADAWSTFFVSADGRPAFAHAKSLSSDGATVVRADVLEKFAKDRGFHPVWIVWVEKDGGKGGRPYMDNEAVFARHDFIGFYFNEVGEWRGELFGFRSPDGAITEET